MTEEAYLETIRMLFADRLSEGEMKEKAKAANQGYLTYRSREKDKAQTKMPSSV